VGGTGASFCRSLNGQARTGAKLMKWTLVVLVAGLTPVKTDLVFDKFSDCLAAEEQMRRHYADAFAAWDQRAAATFERRREYAKARDLQAKRLLSNVGTCVPHGGGDGQPVSTAERQPAQQPATPQAVPTPSPR
jgi:hypothetical protein